MPDSTETQPFSPEYDPDTGTYRVDFDPTECMPSTVVVLAVAAVTESDLPELAVLNERIDPDRLNRLFGPTQGGTPRTGGHVLFPFAGYEVTVDSDGEVILTPQQA